MTAFAKGLLNRVFAGPEGKQLLSSIMDENPVDIQLKVNQRYPDAVPFATMPPEVLRRCRSFRRKWSIASSATT